MKDEIKKVAEYLYHINKLSPEMVTGDDVQAAAYDLYMGPYTRKELRPLKIFKQIINEMWAIDAEEK